MLGNFKLSPSSADFFQNPLFQKILLGTQSECQTVLTQIRTNILSVLICVQTVCKGYHQWQKSPLARKELKVACCCKYLSKEFSWKTIPLCHLQHKPITGPDCVIKVLIAYKCILNPKPIGIASANSMESDHRCTSRIYFDNAGDNVTLTLNSMTLTSQKPH